MMYLAEFLSCISEASGSSKPWSKDSSGNLNSNSNKMPETSRNFSDSV